MPLMPALSHGSQSTTGICHRFLKLREDGQTGKLSDWFSEYTDVVTREYGSKVKNWMVINEQLSFAGNGYMEGLFAPGKKSLKAFMKAVHYSVLANAEGGRIIRKNVPDANIGTTFANT